VISWIDLPVGVRDLKFFQTNLIYKMTKLRLIVYILIIVTLTTCKEEKKTDINSKYYKEFYSVLHESFLELQTN